MTALLWALVSVAGLYAYATIGVAVAKIAEPILKQRWPQLADADGSCADVACPIGIFWCVSLPAIVFLIALSRTALVLSKPPRTWGRRLADLLTGRAGRVRRSELELRELRIARLEKELGIGG